MSLVTIPARTYRIGRTVIAVAAAVGLAWLADSAVAMHAEHTMSQDVKDSSRLEHSPSVYIGGMPYLAATLTKEVPLIEVSVLDVEVPQMGMVRANTTLRDVTVTPDQVLSGDYTGAEVSTLSRSISLDGVAFGRLLDMTDLSIANPKNISPTGGRSAEAELTGTAPGQEDKATVVVTLRLVGEIFEMRPTAVTDMPEGADKDAIIDAFTFDLDTRDLPLPLQATAVFLSGGSISFETQRRETVLDPRQLSPVEIDGDFDSEGNEK